MSNTPRTDREKYTVKECDIGFTVVGAKLCEELEQDLSNRDAQIAELTEHCKVLDQLRVEADVEWARDLAAANAEREELRKDKERLDWLDKQGEAYGTEGVHEGNRWGLDGPFLSARAAIDAAIAAREGKA